MPIPGRMGGGMAAPAPAAVPKAEDVSLIWADEEFSMVWYFEESYTPFCRTFFNKPFHRSLLTPHILIGGEESPTRPIRSSSRYESWIAAGP